MKHIWVTALALVALAATSMAQEQQPQAKWIAHQTMHTAYFSDAQSLLVQRKMARRHVLSQDMNIVMGFQHQQVLLQTYGDETESRLAQGSFLSLMFANGTEVISAWQHDHSKGRVQHHSLGQTVDLNGPIVWQFGISHARMLDQQQSLDHWMMGFVWPGELQAKLLLAHGDDVQHYHYQNDTRMTLGLEKVFGF